MQDKKLSDEKAICGHHQREDFIAKLETNKYRTQQESLITSLPQNGGSCGY